MIGLSSDIMVRTMVKYPCIMKECNKTIGHYEMCVVGNVNGLSMV
jgi:hypothetical protein